MSDIEDVDKYDNSATKDFVLSVTLKDNPHSVTINDPSTIAFEGTNERLDKDSIPVSLNALDMEWGEVPTVSTFVIGEIMYYKPKGDTNLHGTTRYGSGGQRPTSKPLHYDKICVVRCLNSRAGSNLFTILMGQGRNTSLYDEHVSGRDSDLFAPGAIVVIENPDPIKVSLGKGNNMPIMDISGAVRVVKKGSVPMKTVPIIPQSMKQHGFHYESVKIRCLNWHPMNTNCGGLMCDALEMYSDGKAVEKCGCATACRRASSLVVLLQMTLELQDGTKLTVSNFTSKSFTLLFLKNGIPNGISESMVKSNPRKKNKWLARMTNAINFINNKHGFNVTGWVRRGMVEDQSAAGAAAGSGAGKSFIASSDLKIHVTKISINKGPDGKEPDYSRYLFDLASVSIVDGGPL